MHCSLLVIIVTYPQQCFSKTNEWAKTSEVTILVFPFLLIRFFIKSSMSIRFGFFCPNIHSRRYKLCTWRDQTCWGCKRILCRLPIPLGQYSVGIESHLFKGAALYFGM